MHKKTRSNIMDIIATKAAQLSAITNSIKEDKESNEETKLTQIKQAYNTFASEVTTELNDKNYEIKLLSIDADNTAIIAKINEIITQLNDFTEDRLKGLVAVLQNSTK